MCAHREFVQCAGGSQLAVGEAPLAPRGNIRIWHRNYHEIIVRTSEAAKRITEYISA